MITRRTRGGRLTFTDLSPAPACATCRADPGEGPIGVRSEITGGSADGAGLDTSICADCLSEALAILFGRRHVQAGGDVADLG